jgi:hypothetical protein
VEPPIEKTDLIYTRQSDLFIAQGTSIQQPVVLLLAALPLEKALK